MVNRDLNPSLAANHPPFGARLTHASMPSTRPPIDTAATRLPGWNCHIELESGLVFGSAKLRIPVALDCEAEYRAGCWVTIYLRGRSQTDILGIGRLDAQPNTWSMVASPHPLRTRTIVAAAEDFEVIMISLPRSWLQRLGPAGADPVAAFFAIADDRPRTRTGILSPLIRRSAVDLLRPVQSTGSERIRAEARILELLLQLAQQDHPEEAAGGISSAEARALENARAILSAEAAAPPTINQLAVEVGFGATQLKRKFKARYGVTIAEFTANLRLERALRRLSHARTVAEVAYEAGLTPAGFSVAFRRRYGHSPKELLRK